MSFQMYTIGIKEKIDLCFNCFLLRAILSRAIVPSMFQFLCIKIVSTIFLLCNYFILRLINQLFCINWWEDEIHCAIVQSFNKYLVTRSIFGGRRSIKSSNYTRLLRQGVFRNAFEALMSRVVKSKTLKMCAQLFVAVWNTEDVSNVLYSEGHQCDIQVQKNVDSLSALNPQYLNLPGILLGELGGG